MLIVLGMALVILVTVWANIAGLFVARGLRKQKDLAIRLALGAGHMRIVRECVAEALILSSIGAIVGAVLAKWVASSAGTHLLPVGDADFDVTLNGRVVAGTIALAILTAVMAAIAAAARVMNISIIDVVKTGNPLSNARAGLRKVLLSVQVGTAVLLLCGSALFLQTMQKLTTADLGFQPQGLSAFMLAGKAPWSNAGPDYFRELQDRIRNLPGVVAVGLTNNAPMEMGRDFPEPVSTGSGGPSGSGARYCVWPGAFRALGTPLLEGRDFTAQDHDTVILDRELAGTLFGTATALGRTIVAGQPSRTQPPHPLVVVGVSGALKLVSARQPARSFFVPCVREWKSPETAYAMTLVVRSARPLSALEPEGRKEVNPLGEPFVYRLATEPQLIASSTHYERMLATVATVFGTPSLVLAAVGLYALIAFVVASRMREFGIRMAVGASGRDLMWLVNREVLGVVAIGSAAGLAASFLLAKSLASFLFGVQPADVPTFAAVVVLTTLVAMVAAYLPGRRASRLDPACVLRQDQHQTGRVL